MYAQKRKHSAMEKTPVSMLQELCDRERDTLQYTYEVKAQMFVCEVKALGIVCIDVGQTKKVAKQKACANIICE